MMPTSHSATVDATPPSNPRGELEYDRSLSVTEAASYLGLSASCLNKWRCWGGGPHFIRLAPHRVAYLKSDLDGWRNERRYSSTSQYSIGGDDAHVAA